MKVAMCARCGDVLVATMLYRKFEFYCVTCGAKYGYSSPWSADETPELLALLVQRRAEFETLSEGALAEGGMKLDTCDLCKERHQPHFLHATPAELAADTNARARLRGRAGLPLGE